ncbi:transglycosylase SLT domain-containing protein [Virgibacillus profundi]|nr:transglycosylase SLT domain-containing protein [Virgibacillus profundi]
MEQFDQATAASASATDSHGSAMRENEAYLDSYEAKINKVKNAWTEAIIGLEEDVLGDAITNFTNAAIPTLNTFTKMIDTIGLLAPVFGVAGVAILAFSSKLRTASITSGTYIADLIKGMRAGDIAIGAHVKSHGMMQTAIHGSSRAFSSFAKVGAGALRFLAGAALPIAGFMALGAAISWVSGKIADRNKAIDDYQRSNDQSIKSIQSEKDNISQLVSEYEKLENVGENDRNIEQETRYVELQNELGDLLPTVVKYEDEKGNRILENTGIVKEHISALEEQIAFERDLAAESAETNIAFSTENIEQAREEMKKLEEDLAYYREEMAEAVSKGTNKGMKDAEFWDNMIAGVQVDMQEYRDTVTGESEKIQEAYEAIVYKQAELANVDLNNSEITWLGSMVKEAEIAQDEIGDFANKVSTLKKELGDGYSLDGLDINQLEKLNEVIGTVSTGAIESEESWDLLRASLVGAEFDAEEADEVIGILSGTLDKASISADGAEESTEGFANSLENASDYADHFRTTMLGISSDTNEVNQSLLNSYQILQELGKQTELTTAQEEEYQNVKDNLIAQFPHLVEGSNLNIKAMQNEIAANEVLSESTDLLAKGKLSSEDAKTVAQAMGTRARMESMKKEIQAQFAVIQAHEEAQKAYKEAANANVGLMEREMAEMEMIHSSGAASKARGTISELKSSIDALMPSYQSQIGALGEVNESLAKSNSASSKASEASDKASESAKNMAKEYESTTYVLDKYALALENLNLELEKQNSIQSKYPEHSNQYRKALEKELELLKEKKTLTKEQADDLRSQIASGNIRQTGVVTGSDASGTYTGKYANEINKSAQKYGVSPFLIASIIQQESSFNSRAVSGAGARGLMQLMPATARELGVKDSFNPAQNIDGGTKYIAQQLKAFGGDLNKALAAYNAGAGNVRKYGGIPPFEETQNYVKKVNSNLESFGSAVGNTTAQVKSSNSKMNETANYYLDQFTTTSGYGMRKHPTKGTNRMHHGVDLANGRSGDAVKALRSGKVTIAGYDKSAGNWVVIEQDDGTVAKYMHMLGDLRVKKGQRVDAGQQLGRVGSTGDSTGAHLHLQIDRNGQSIDPMKYLEELSKTAAQSRGNVEDARSSLVGLQGDMLSIDDQIEELYFAIVESHLAAFDHAKAKLNKGLAEVDYFQSRYHENSNAWAKQQVKREKLMQQQIEQQKSSIKWLEREIKSNKNLTAAQKMRLDDTLRERQIEMWNMEQQILEQRISMYQRLEDVVKRSLEAQKEVALKAVDDLISEIDDKEKEREYQKRLKDQQDNRQEILNELAELGIDDSDAAKKRIKELNESLQESEEEIDNTQRDKAIEDRKKSLNEEREEIEKNYDDLINDEQAFMDMRSQVIEGNTDNIKKKLDAFYKDIGTMTDQLGKSVVKNLQRAISQINNAYFPNAQGIDIPEFDGGGGVKVKSRDGGLAVLHDDEFVLKPDDTENILNSVKINRDLIGQFNTPNVPRLNRTDGDTSNETNITVHVANSSASKKETQDTWAAVIEEANRKGIKF